MIHERAITLLSGRYGGRAAPQACLEFAQEHFLAWMAAEGLFDGDHLVFKGGTALRKFNCRAGGGASPWLLRGRGGPSRRCHGR